MDGVIVEQSGESTLCRIENFSEELKQRIRENLAAIAQGVAQVESLPEYFSYQNTLQRFLDRYVTKDENSKKGMIGELLSHILLPELFEELTSLSILFNKEERNVKKGFDIIYCNLSEKSLWYSEVKSGHKNSSSTSDNANETLLKRAYEDLKEKFLEGRESLWTSALIDVVLTLDANNIGSVKELLSADSPLNALAKSEDKNAILISVLYENPGNPVSIENLNNFLKQLKENGEFQSAIVFSIQKETFERVQDFLISEVPNA